MADVIVGAKLEADASGAINNVRDFKKELRLAQQEVVILSEKFGSTSKEAADAAKKAAKLKDEIGDARQLVDAFNPDTKFRAFGASIQTVVGGFTALTGAMGLFGVESEEVQKTLLKVQSALALSQGISQLQEGIGAIKNLGSVLVNTLGKSGLIGVAIAGITALGVAIFGVTKRNKELEDSQKEYNKSVIETRQEVAKIQNAFDQARLGIISKADALKQYNSTMGQTVGQAKDLNEAEKLVADNADKYIKVQALKAKSNFLLAKSAELSGSAEMARLELEKMVAADFIKSAFENKIKEQEQRAKELESLVDNINKELSGLSSGFKTTTTGKATTSAGKIKEKEVEEVSAFQKMLNDIANEQAKKEAEVHDLKIQRNTELTASNNQATIEYLANKQKESEAALAQQLIEEQTANARIRTFELVASISENLADILGKHTAAGKVLAVASATINTYLAASKALADNYTAYGPAAPFIRAATVANVILLGLKQVKEILKVQVPGGRGGGGSVPSASVSAPLQASLPASTNTRLDRDQLNQIGNAAVRAFVVEQDVSSNQERIRRLNRAARIG